jgi:hypothetical protein
MSYKKRQKVKVKGCGFMGLEEYRAIICAPCGNGKWIVYYGKHVIHHEYEVRNEKDFIKYD